MLRKNYELQQRIRKAEERRLQEAVDVAEALAKLEAAGQQDVSQFAAYVAPAAVNGTIILCTDRCT